MKPKELSKRQLKRLQYRNGGLLENSRITYGYAVRSYFRHCLVHGMTEAFDEEQIREWLCTIRNPYTHNLYRQALKEFYLKQYDASKMKRITVLDAFASFKRMKPSYAKVQNISYLTYNQIDRLARIATPRVRSYIMGLFWTGCRISELVNIRITDCREAGNYININVIGKGRKGRHVYMPVDEYRIALKLFNGHTYLYETQDHRQCNRKHISQEIRRQARRLVHMDIHAHTLRHSKAMFLKDTGMSTDKIAKALGHADVSTTLMFYSHGLPTPEEQRIGRGSFQKGPARG
jgi:integrase